MAESNNSDKSKRIYKTLSSVGGLNRNIPLPNIVRIEILNSVARNRYLGKLQRISSNLKTAVMNNLIQRGLDKFYGFMKGSSQRTISMGSGWASIGDAGPGILGTVRSIISGGTSNFSGNIGQALELGRDLTGISMNTTGSASMKRYSGSELNDFSIDCGWYIPEQHKICIKSLKSILRMAYPNQVDVSENTIRGSISNVVDEFQKGSQDVVNKVTHMTDNLLSSFLSFGADKEKEKETSKGENSVKSPDNKNKNKDLDLSIVKNIIGDLATTILNPSTVDFFGKNLTFDPLPVRCCIGQFIDIEPLVISKVSITLSNETFVNSNGLHLPLFISVNIELKFWMQPPPNFEFMQLLGEEMFG